VYISSSLNKLDQLTSSKIVWRDRLFSTFESSSIWHAFAQAAVAENYRETYSEAR